MEKVFVAEGRRRGALVLKLASPGCAGVPDRMVLLPGGVCRFVEVKAPGRGPRPLQRRVFGRFAALGHAVDVVDSADAARSWWEGL